MKYLLKFKIETWSPYIDSYLEGRPPSNFREYHSLSLKVEVDEGRIRKEGLYELSQTNCCARLIFHCELLDVDGPKELRHQGGNLLFLLWDGKYYGCKEVSLDTYDTCIVVRYLGREVLEE